MKQDRISETCKFRVRIFLQINRPLKKLVVYSLIFLFSIVNVVAFKVACFLFFLKERYLNKSSKNSHPKKHPNCYLWNSNFYSTECIEGWTSINTDFLYIVFIFETNRDSIIRFLLRKITQTFDFFIKAQQERLDLVCSQSTPSTRQVKIYQKLTPASTV